MAPPNHARGGFLSYSEFDKTALKDTAKNVIPRAVASAQSFLNFFFRGRMEASFSKNNKFIILKNVSDPTLVAYPDLVTFKKGSKLKVIYTTTSGENVELLELESELSKDVKVGETFVIEVPDAIDRLNITPRVPGKSKFIVLLDGQIGRDYADEFPSVPDDYNLNTTGLSVAYVNKSFVLQTQQSISNIDFDDGFYQRGTIHAFERDDEKDTVVDYSTELMWQDNLALKTTMKPWVSRATWGIEPSDPLPLDPTDVSGDTAFTYCNTLTLGDYLDWRLPSATELLTLVNSSFVLSGHGLSGFENNNDELGKWSTDSFSEFYDNFHNIYRTRTLDIAFRLNTDFKNKLKSVLCVRSVNQ